jgi:hypothetical protein
MVRGLMFDVCLGSRTYRVRRMAYSGLRFASFARASAAKAGFTQWLPSAALSQRGLIIAIDFEAEVEVAVEIEVAAYCHIQFANCQKPIANRHFVSCFRLLIEYIVMKIW